MKSDKIVVQTVTVNFQISITRNHHTLDGCVLFYTPIHYIFIQLSNQKKGCPKNNLIPKGKNYFPFTIHILN